MSSRDDVLAAIRQSLSRGTGDGPPEEVTDRLAAKNRNLIPARATGLDRAGLIETFERYASNVDVTFDRVGDLAAVPETIAAYLSAQNLPAKAVRAPDPLLDEVPWDTFPTLDVRAGVPLKEDQVGVTSAAAGIAETGTCMMLSGPEHPSTLNFLPETQIVVLPADRLVAAPEDAWYLVRHAGSLPRTVNMVTGPSRSGDIEQTILLGAHGPRRLHIVLVDGSEA